MRFLHILTMLLMISCGSDDEPDLQQKEQPPGTVLKVMTYNIHIGNPPSKPSGSVDLEAIAKVIKAADPDLVALQEVDVYTNRSGTSLHQARTLAKLTGLNYFFTKAIDYDGGMFGDAVLSKLPILDSVRYELPVTDKLGGETRSVAMIKVQVDSDSFLWFASTHLDHYSADNNRQLQAKELVNKTKNLTDPLIIGGDFNDIPTSATIKILTDAGFSMGCKGYCDPTFSSQNPIKTIDYVLFKPLSAFEIVTYRSINEDYASDHLPVLSEIQMKP